MKLRSVARRFGLGWGVVQQPSEVHPGQSWLQVQFALRLWSSEGQRVFGVGKHSGRVKPRSQPKATYSCGIRGNQGEIMQVPERLLWARLKKAYKQAMSKWEDEYECPTELSPGWGGSKWWEQRYLCQTRLLLDCMSLRQESCWGPKDAASGKIGWFHWIHWNSGVVLFTIQMWWFTMISCQHSTRSIPCFFIRCFSAAV